MKPIVGVMPLWDDEKESIWMLPGYMDGIHHAGGIPIILPFSTDETEIKGLTQLFLERARQEEDSLALCFAAA